MVDSDLVCNFKKCRKRLTTFAWVTSCSHIFCDEDGTREFNKTYVCPACETNLSGKFDIIRTDLQPSEQYKSMVLAGQRPEIIMEICSRSISFWTYQAHQERVYHEYVGKKAKEAKTQLEQYYEQLVTKLQADISSIKGEVSAKSKELTDLKRRFSELSEKHLEKARQHQRLQTLYDGLRRRSIDPSSLDDSMIHQNRGENMQSFRSLFSLPLGTANGIQRVGSMANLSEVDRGLYSKGESGNTSPTREFVLRPVPTPDLGTARQNESRGNMLPQTLTMNQSRFALQIATPSNTHRNDQRPSHP